VAANKERRSRASSLQRPPTIARFAATQKYASG
jgi:hypothetical protein